jgi:arsenite methyltransferase
MTKTNTATNAPFIKPMPRPDYGVDAPGVVRGLLGGGGAACLGAVLLSGIIGGFAWILVLVGMVLLVLGTSMLAYAYVGKHMLREHLLAQREWRGDEVVLDIGAGRGLMAIGAALRAPHGTVIALDIWSQVDLSDNTPEELTKNAKLLGVSDTIEIVTGDARKLDMPDASVDVVVSVFCIHNIEPASERAFACQEIARVLKPGGMAAIADFPGVVGYVDIFEKAGLKVIGPMRGEAISFTISAYLFAVKAA